MSDSPYCQECLKEGKLANMYKLAGKPSFYCSKCRRIYPNDLFDPEELKWKQDFKTWKSHIKSRIVGHKDAVKDMINEQIGKLEKTLNVD